MTEGQTLTYHRYAPSSWNSNNIGVDRVGRTHLTADGHWTLCGKDASYSRSGFYEAEGKEADCGQCLARQKARTKESA